MTEAQMRSTMASLVAVAVSDLSNEELAVLNLVAQLDQDPRGRLFDYEKVAHLFTEQDGTRMHDEAKRALSAVVLARL